LRACTVCLAPLITDSLFARERLGSTGLGHGVAIPHGRIKGLKAPMAAVFQLRSPSASMRPTKAGQPADLPAGARSGHAKHLEILSEIAELLSDSQLARAPQASWTLPSCTA
jgi:PTS system nitrogen regulatory IIA component